jgi:F0F1-type ATP synthase membrane subunit b/b'
MEDSRMDLKFYQDAYNKQQAQMDTLNAELLRLNAELAKSRQVGRAPIKKAIRNVEQQITKLTVTMRKTQENITEQTLALQGIDQDSAKLQGVSNIIGGVAQTAGAIMGAGGLSGISQAKQQTAQTQLTTEAETEQNRETVKGKSNMIMYLVVGAVVLFLMMKKK